MLLRCRLPLPTPRPRLCDTSARRLRLSVFWRRPNRHPRSWRWLADSVSSTHGDVDFQRLLDAFSFEERNDFSNAQGQKERFATFASRSVKLIAVVPLKLRDHHNRVSIGFEHYASLDQQTRQSIVASGRNLLALLTQSSASEIVRHGDPCAPQKVWQGIVYGAKKEIHWPLPEQNGPSDESAAEEEPAGDVTSEREQLLKKSTTAFPSAARALSRFRPVSLRELTRACFDKSAEESSSSEEKSESELVDMEQGSEAWKEFRRSRLTASSLSSVLGMFGNPQECIHNIWLEKIGRAEPFAGNELTRWGSLREKDAFAQYRQMTGHVVERRGIGVLGSHRAEDWIGASPDGIVQISNLSAQDTRLPDSVQRILFPCPSQGLLEIKCPAGQRGPGRAKPYGVVPYYYIPQVQCLMEVFDMDWCHLYCWTVNHGSRIFFIPRDEMYFGKLYHYVAKFWWEHVIPAKRCLEYTESRQDYREFAPTDLDPRHLVAESRRLAAAARYLSFPVRGKVKAETRT